MKIRFVIFLCVTILCNYHLSSQVIVKSKAKVENVNFGYVMQQVVITYDLINTRFNEKFTITLKVYNTKGEEIPVSSVSGDIGEKISGEGKKKITWNIHRDLEKLDDNIYVVIEADLKNPKIIKPISREIGLVYSTIYPGYGGSRITGKKIHLLKGIAGYGLIGSSIIIRGQASSSYDSYKIETNLDKRDEYYQKVESQLLTSRLLLAGAGLVWISDYLTVLLSENKILNLSDSQREISFQPTVTSGCSIPGFSLRITF
jgi:hypothetical protein